MSTSGRARGRRRLSHRGDRPDNLGPVPGKVGPIEYRDVWWTGGGILALLFPAITVFAGYQLAGYPGVPAGFLVASVATWFVGRRINRTPDKQDNYRNCHRFMSIPMQY